MNKCLKSMIISMLLIIALPMAKLSAQVSTWDGTWEPWTHGTGTASNPFLIENAQQLAYLAYRVNNGLDAGGGHVSNHDYHYKLMVDVDLNGSEDFQWTPIGYWNSDTDYQCFGGYFDGNNYMVLGMYINGSANRVGFFGYADGATIKNLCVKGDLIATTGVYAGGIVGYSNDTDIAFCSNNGNVSIICNCYYANVSSGGITGVAKSSVITNCYNSGSVMASNVIWGPYGNSPANVFSGGICGCSNSVVITNCYNTNQVSSESSGNGERYSYSGGILGYDSGSSGNISTIFDCYNTGTLSAVSSNSTWAFSYVGGILGDSCYPNGIVLNCCYNTGDVHGDNAGGIIGYYYYNNPIAVINSYYLNTCGGNNVGGEPKTEIYMKSQEFVNVLNGETCSWEQDTQPYQNSGYPILTMISVEVSTMDIITITQTHAVLHGSIYTENTAVSSQGFQFKKSSDPHYQTVSISNSGYISTTISGLTPNTEYTYRAFCTPEYCETYYGEEKTFTTLPVSVTTDYATDVTGSSATLQGSIDIGDATLVSKGFEYRKVGNPNYTTVNVAGNDNNYNAQLTGLTVNTTYEYRAFMNIAENATTYYGNTSTFEVSWLNSDTICINNADMLRWVSEQCNSGTTFEGKYIKLMNDITLPLNVPNNMTSIGVYPDYPFKGTFDGNGKHIYNLYIDQPNTPYQGFFGYTLNANLYNVGLVNITASGRNYTGGMVAYAENTYLRDCYVNGGTLFALSYCGGLVGYQQQGTNSIISGCYNTCEVSGNNYVGGLVGFSNYSTVRNSYVAAMVAAQGDAVGSIIGGANEVLMYYTYFNAELTGQTNAIGWNNTGGGKDGGEAMTSAQMRDPQFVATLNSGLTVHVWKQDYTMHINNGFPILQWQVSTGIEENGFIKAAVYPNPTNGNITIEAEDLKHITISNMLGQIIYEGKANGEVFEYDFGKHGAGLYLIRIETADGVALKKVSVVR